MAEDSEYKSEGVSVKTEQELTKQLIRRLENWREILIHLHTLLTFEKLYFSGIVVGVITFIFLMLWYFDPSVLTALSIFGILVCVSDYVVPILSSSFFDSSKWDRRQEYKYEQICHDFVTVYLSVRWCWDSIRQIKESKPYLYFIGVLGFLIFTAWIGNLMNNLLLTYFVVLSASLMPGVKHHRLFENILVRATTMIKAMTGQTTKKKN